jgi:glycosyltransferase involved in cell wall biosynthesis
MRLDRKYRVVSLCEDDRVDRRILDGARMLSEEGWPTLVIAAPPLIDLRDEESYPDVPIFRMPSNVVRPGLSPRGTLPHEALIDSLFPWSRRVTAAALAFPAEVYIANDLPQLAAGIIAARRHGSTLIYDAHEFFPAQPFVKERAQKLETIERDLIAYAHGIVTVNDSIADVMTMHYTCMRPRILLNCPSRRHQKTALTDDGRLRKFLGITPTQRVLLYQGNLTAFRNLEEMIDGMALLQSPDVVLALMGRASDFSGGLQQRAERLGLLGKRVFFIPEQSAANLLAWTAGADAGIIPYPHTDLNTLMCTPNKLYEFLASGLPILASHGTELRRFVGDIGVGQNAHLQTPQDFARAIDAFMAGPLDVWRAKSIELSARYTWETEGRLWFDIIRDAQAVHRERPWSAIVAASMADSAKAPSLVAPLRRAV